MKPVELFVIAPVKSSVPPWRFSSPAFGEKTPLKRERLAGLHAGYDRPAVRYRAGNRAVAEEQPVVLQRGDGTGADFDPGLVDERAGGSAPPSTMTGVCSVTEIPAVEVSTCPALRVASRPRSLGTLELVREKGTSKRSVPSVQLNCRRAPAACSTGACRRADPRPRPAGHRGPARRGRGAARHRPAPRSRPACTPSATSPRATSSPRRSRGGSRRSASTTSGSTPRACPDVAARFPTVAASCAAIGVDLARDPDPGAARRALLVRRRRHRHPRAHRGRRALGGRGGRAHRPARRQPARLEQPARGPRRGSPRGRRRRARRSPARGGSPSPRRPTPGPCPSPTAPCSGRRMTRSAGHRARRRGARRRLGRRSRPPAPSGCP